MLFAELRNPVCLRKGLTWCKSATRPATHSPCERLPGALWSDPNGDTTKLREQNHSKLTNKAKSDRHILRAAPRFDRSFSRRSASQRPAQRRRSLMLFHNTTVETSRMVARLRGVMNQCSSARYVTGRYYCTATTVKWGWWCVHSPEVACQSSV